MVIEAHLREGQPLTVIMWTIGAVSRCCGRSYLTGMGRAKGSITCCVCVIARTRSFTDAYIGLVHDVGRCLAKKRPHPKWFPAVYSRPHAGMNRRWCLRPDCSHQLVPPEVSSFFVLACLFAVISRRGVPLCWLVLLNQQDVYLYPADSRTAQVLLYPSASDCICLCMTKLY